MLKNILITGAAGFIGAALSEKFLDSEFNVLGIDSLNDYYDINLKKARLKNIEQNKFANKNWNFERCLIEDKKSLEKVFEKFQPNVVVNLAAQAGVRYSIKNPSSYVNSNLFGFFNVLDLSRIYSVNHLVYASSSSVYGSNTEIPFLEEHSVDHPLSFYAATKKSNELMAHVYSNVYSLPTTGLRFFTVYGPWGRPDMAPMIFAKAILEGTPINVFNNGKMNRDFTYIDDIVEATYRCCLKPATRDQNFDSKKPDASKSFAPYRVFNIGNSKPINLLKFIEILEYNLEMQSEKIFLPMQVGDVVSTFSNTKKLEKWINYKPKINLEYGIKKFVDWYKNYYD